MKVRIFCLITVAMLGFSHPVGATLVYQITDLGTFGGYSSYAYGINDSGQVVGAAQTPNGDTRAFLWQSGTMIDLGTLGGASYAWDINNVGQIVGSSQWVGPLGWATSVRYHPVIWNSGTITDLGSLNLGILDPFRGDALSINDDGVIVGNSYYHATIWDDGNITDLGTFLGNHAFASDINDSGQIVGYFYGPNTFNGFYYDQGAITILDPGYAFGINNNGQVVGASNGIPYTWSSGVAQNLLPPEYQGGEAMKINDKGQIVGYLTSLNGMEAVLWENENFIRLNDLIPNTGWHLEYASDINEHGQIIGYGISPNGYYHGFILTPTQVSIPNSLLNLIIGIGVLIIFIHQKSKQRRFTMTEHIKVKNPAASGGALKATQTDSTVNPQLFRCDDVECSGG